MLTLKWWLISGKFICKIGSGFTLFKALALTPSSTIVILLWFINLCKWRFCNRLCVKVPLTGKLRFIKVMIRAAVAIGSHKPLETMVICRWFSLILQFLSDQVYTEYSRYQCASTKSILPWLEISDLRRCSDPLVYECTLSEIVQK